MQAPALASLASRRFRPYVGTAQGVRRSGCAAFGLPARQVRIAPLKETGRTASGSPNPKSKDIRISAASSKPPAIPALSVEKPGLRAFFRHRPQRYGSQTFMLQPQHRLLSLPRFRADVVTARLATGHGQGRAPHPFNTNQPLYPLYAAPP